MSTPNLLAAVLLAFAIVTRPDVDDARYRALAEHADFASVCHLTLAGGSGAGSGVVVAPRWVLTAAHVVFERDATLLRVHVGGVTRRVTRAVTHPGYAATPRGLGRTAFDHALIELDAPVDVPSARLASTLPAPGALATLVGYGVGGPGGRDEAGIRRAAHNRIDQIGGMWRRSPLADHLLLADFDLAGRPQANVMGVATPEPLEGLASGGDSGGGLFIDEGGQPTLVGTFSVSMVELGSLTDGSFAGGVNIWVGIAPHLAWLRETIGS